MFITQHVQWLITVIFWGANLVETIEVQFHVGDSVSKGHTFGNLRQLNSSFPSPQYSIIKVIESDKYFSISNDSSFKALVDIDRDVMCADWVCCSKIVCTVTAKIFAMKDTQTFTTIVHIYFRDENDNAPYFQNDHTMTIPENAQINSTWRNLPRAEDKDSTSYSIRKFVIDDPSFTFRSGFAETNANTLVVLKNLNREVRESYIVKLMASDVNHTTSINLTILIGDVNDEVPVFQNTTTTTKSIFENTTVGAVVAKFIATDQDAGDNGVVVYKLGAESTPRTMATDKFLIDGKSGEVKVRSELDYEVPQGRSYRLLIEASDRGEATNTATATLLINIMDCNDNTPKIDLFLEQPVVENTATAQTACVFEVRDSDEMSRNLLSCDMTQADGFKMQYEIDANVYKIVSTRAFDYEREQIVYVRVSCFDRAVPPLQISHQFSISIKDENDNSPRFLAPEYSTVLSEAAKPSEPVVKVNAEDKDGGAFGTVLYSLDAIGATYFDIAPQSGNIYVRSKLDREKLNPIVFHVTASDGAVPPGTSSVKVTVQLSDVNEPPVYEGDAVLRVKEDTPAGRLVGKINFVDGDSGNNGSYRVTYSHDDNVAKRYFSVASNGEIYLNKTVDYENVTNMYLKLIAVDKGSPPLTGSVEVLVFVDDVNDNAPICKMKSGSGDDLPIVIGESLLGTLAASIDCTDADVGKNKLLEYNIASSNGSRYFAIGTTTGRIHTNWTREQRPVLGIYQLIVAVHDMGTPQLTTTLSLLVDISNTPTDADSLNGDKSIASAAFSRAVILIVIVIASIVLCGVLVVAICYARKKSLVAADDEDNTKYVAPIMDEHVDVPGLHYAPGFRDSLHMSESNGDQFTTSWPPNYSHQHGPVLIDGNRPLIASDQTYNPNQIKNSETGSFSDSGKGGSMDDMHRFLHGMPMTSFKRSTQPVVPNNTYPNYNNAQGGDIAPIQHPTDLNYPGLVLRPDYDTGTNV